MTAVEQVLLASNGTLAAAAFAFLVLGTALVLRARDPVLALACVGLFTISWDQVSLRLGGMTLKPSYVVFAVALGLDILGTAGAGPRPPIQARAKLVRGAALASLVLLAVATALGGYLLEGVRQMFAVVVGGLMPALVCFRVGRSAERRQVLIKWVLIGAGFAAAIGIYQFAAFYLELPAPFPYTGVAGSLGRTAGLSYEPAFFSMYLIGLLPFTVALLLKPKAERPIRCAPGLIFGLMLIGLLVSNARAGYVALPLALVIPLVARSRRSVIRARPIALLAGSLVLVMMLSVMVGFNLPGFVTARLASVTDTQERASNARRLALYDADRQIAADHLVVGIGPGALGHYLPAYGLPETIVSDLSRAVANNIWLQAVLDSGLLGPVVIVVVFAVLLQMSRRRQEWQSRWLSVGALLVLLIGGLLTSNFWDAKTWVLIGLALAADGGKLLGEAPEEEELVKPRRGGRALSLLAS